MNVRSVNHAGWLVASALRGSWSSAGTSELTQADFEATTALLYDSGAAGLGWWSIRNTDLAHTASGELLHQAFRLLTLQAAIHQTKIERVFRCFRSVKVEPILIKGWAVARRYPQPGLRPYGDIDLLIRPDDLSLASSVVSSEELRDCRIDLHPGAFELNDRPLADLFSRSKLVPCGTAQVRVLSDEDHLALLAIHFLKHAGWRPLWLCDVGLALESMSEGFNWEACLGTDKRRGNWILSASGLACELLGASIRDRVAAHASVPRWLIESVLTNWARPFTGQHDPPITACLRNPHGVIADLKGRWPDPILATITVNGTFRARRRLRYQMRNCLQRAVRLVWPAGPIQHPTA